jgi:hypothetical protein
VRQPIVDCGGPFNFPVQPDAPPLRRVMRLVGDTTPQSGIQKISTLKFWRDLALPFVFSSTLEKGASPPAGRVNALLGLRSPPRQLVSHIRASSRRTCVWSQLPPRAFVMPIAFRPAARARSVVLPAACSRLIVGARSAARDATRFSIASSASARTLLVGSRSLLLSA